MQRIAITGSSGYYGRKLIEHIRAQGTDARILGCDIAPPGESAPDEFHQLDIRDSRLQEILEAFRPDTVIHLAFVVDPIHNEGLMRSINFDGTCNLFAAVRHLRPARFLMASSATAYGAFPDNPLPIDESHHVRPRSDFRYSVDKAELERMIVDLAADLPETIVSWTRPAVIYGPGVNNYLSTFLTKLPIIVLMDGHDAALQFVHEEDVVAATWSILQANARGPFNIGPPDWVHFTQIAADTGRRMIKIPFWMVRLTTTCWWGLRLPWFRFPPGLLHFLRHPWVVAPNRLQRELGFRFKYSSRQTLQELLRQRGQLAPHLRNGTRGPTAEQSRRINAAAK